MYLGHGAPPLVDDPLWIMQLDAWAGALPRPTAILVVSAHWEAAPLTIGATADAAPLVYDFYGLPRALLPGDLPGAGSAGRSRPRSAACCQGPSRWPTPPTAAWTTAPTCR